ncbi:MAG TPA: response regulator transcription factor [Solirubrobacteraceae bacterium]|nr:response regulator transcription factor [Solirubrobacteraceae bacterium]
MSIPLKAGVMIADDHGLVRDGLRVLIDAAPDLEVVSVAGDGIAAVERALDPRVHLAILDVAMPRRTGLQAARELARRRPELRILMLSMHDVDEYFLEAVKAGASGYVLKTVADRDLVEACRAALRGETFIYPGTVRALLREHLERAADADDGSDVLTAREQEVVKLVAEGHTSEEIAQALVISPRTVERHRENVLAKLGLRNRVELTRYAIRQGLVEP